MTLLHFVAFSISVLQYVLDSSWSLMIFTVKYYNRIAYICLVVRPIALHILVFL